MLKPRALKICNKAFLINTDFRAWINYERLLNDDKLNFNEKINHLLKLIYIDEVPNNLYLEALEISDYFYCCKQVNNFLTQEQKEIKILKEKLKSINDEREKEKINLEIGSIKNKLTINKTIYSFDKDINFFKASFMEVYNFDPWRAKYLHWWDFKAYFDGLLGLNYKNILEIRQANVKDYKGESLINIKKLQNQYDIEEFNVEQEIEIKNLMNLLNNGGTEEDFVKYFGG